MSLLSKADIQNALRKLGELAADQGLELELLAVGGAVMVLEYDARPSTHDVDVAILLPKEAKIARRLAEQVAIEFDWPADWLNDGAKSYIVGMSPSQTIYSSRGIVVRRPSIAQLVAMKISAWRDDVDIADAEFLLSKMSGSDSQIWEQIEPHLVPGRELKARFAFLDLWENLHDNN